MDACNGSRANQEGTRGAKHRRDLLTVLQRTTQPEHGEAADSAARLLDHLVLNHTRALAGDLVAVVIDTPGQLVDRLLAHTDGLDEESLDALNMALPHQSLVLMDVAHRVAERLAALAQASASANKSTRGLWAWLSSLYARLRRKPPDEEHLAGLRAVAPPASARSASACPTSGGARRRSPRRRRSLPSSARAWAQRPEQG